MTHRGDMERRLADLRETITSPPPSRSVQVASVLRCVHDRLFDPCLNVKAIKAACRIGDHNISSRFKFEMGVSIKRYIEMNRLQAACALLEDPHYTVAEAAWAVGYAHVQTFYCAFGRHFGVPPGEARRDVPPTPG
jgi:transcriptional regulator GlxA family with amidase domain